MSATRTQNLKTPATADFPKTPQPPSPFPPPSPRYISPQVPDTLAEGVRGPVGGFAPSKTASDLVHLNKFTAPPPPAPLPGQGFNLPANFPGTFGNLEDNDPEGIIPDMVEKVGESYVIHMAERGVEGLGHKLGAMGVGEYEPEGEGGFAVEVQCSAEGDEWI
ncbi:hypothetical protein DFP72DRAFT_844869 [Ephemerocybe angulata]|uniref:Uncharacterized protein n=1 Tax=Ephemerocybe angulata TaxID=980116 RepID=A0A8H6I4A2_9AGAR|nr:hypothetical protein DFP72DRAFT_844869 [Tulosesus angulatus]